ncbi:lipocalin family protein [Cellulophaga sp. 20_2_10]|uniref:lipocalin family protein n=1 Tax=Cellulophaga sp. 20_2_10 TaxID=2942476 RepID=UPI00201AC19F|nr:lipocalin family protein [Cellulophaga sp. 20_2_10]MCL5244913.1 lipocalin family protein [Cellulophaga sp. 20_2_10]
MRYVVCLLFLGVVACGLNKDDDNDIPLTQGKLVGAWQLDATKISPGTVVKEWTAVKDGDIIKFNADYTFTHTNSYNCNNTPITGSYTFKEDIISFKGKCNDEDYSPSYYVTFKDDKIILGFIGCIEECSYRYARK